GITSSEKRALPVIRRASSTRKLRAPRLDASCISNLSQAWLGPRSKTQLAAAAARPTRAGMWVNHNGGFRAEGHNSTSARQRKDYIIGVGRLQSIRVR